MWEYRFGPQLYVCATYMWFQNGKNNRRLHVLSMQILSGLRRMKKKKMICFVCIRTNQQDTFVVILDPLDGALHILRPPN